MALWFLRRTRSARFNPDPIANLIDDATAFSAATIFARTARTNRLVSFGGKLLDGLSLIGALAMTVGRELVRVGSKIGLLGFGVYVGAKLLRLIARPLVDVVRMEAAAEVARDLDIVDADILDPA